MYIDDPLTQDRVCESIGKGKLWNLTLADGRICKFTINAGEQIINIVGLTQIDKETYVGPDVTIHNSKSARFYFDGKLIGNGK